MQTNTKKWLFSTIVLAGLAISITACNKPQEPTPMGSPLGSSQANVEVADSEITMKVKAALAENEILRQSHIDVVTTKGDVALTGFVGSQSEIDLATAITQKIAGVHTIHEHMTKP